LLSLGKPLSASCCESSHGGQHARPVAGDDPHELAIAAWSQVHGLATLLLASQLPLEDDTESEALMRDCLHSLSARWR
jgi:hypothetical protein